MELTPEETDHYEKLRKLLVDQEYLKDDLKVCWIKRKSDVCLRIVSCK